MKLPAPPRTFVPHIGGQSSLAIGAAAAATVPPYVLAPPPAAATRVKQPLTAPSSSSRPMVSWRSPARGTATVSGHRRPAPACVRAVVRALPDAPIASARTIGYLGRAAVVRKGLSQGVSVPICWHRRPVDKFGSAAAPGIPYRGLPVLPACGMASRLILIYSADGT